MGFINELPCLLASGWIWPLESQLENGGSRVKSEDLFFWFPMRLPWAGCSLIEIHCSCQDGLLYTALLPSCNEPFISVDQGRATVPLLLALGRCTMPCGCDPAPFQPFEICSFVNKPFSNYPNKKMSSVCQKSDWYAFKYVYFLVSFVPKKSNHLSVLRGGERRNKSPKLGSKVKFSVTGNKWGWT